MFEMHTVSAADRLRAELVQRVRTMANAHDEDLTQGAERVATELAAHPAELLRVWQAVGPEMVSRVAHAP